MWAEGWGEAEGGLGRGWGGGWESGCAEGVLWKLNVGVKLGSRVVPNQKGSLTVGSDWYELHDRVFFMHCNNNLLSTIEQRPTSPASRISQIVEPLYPVQASITAARPHIC